MNLTQPEVVNFMIMRTLKYLSFILVLAAWGCKPQSNYEIGDPSSKLEGIRGDWKVGEVVFVDEVSTNKNEGDLTDYFTETNDAFSVNFDSDAFSYTVTGALGAKYLGTGGTWSFDDNEFPTAINFSPSDGTDPYTATLLGPIREVDNTLIIQVFRGCASSGTANMSIKFTFDRQNS